MSSSKRLSKALASSKVIPFEESSRIIIMSDCHRGDGSWGDNFSNNQNLYFAALSFYYECDFTYIELGDGDELWENRNIQNIIQTHSDAFWLISLFYQDGRFHMIYGNHDIVKKDPKYARTQCNSFYCDSTKSDLSLFPDIEISEGILLRYRNTDYDIFLTHGHQGDTLNSTLWKLARFLVRYFWRPLELLGIKDPTSAAKNNRVKNNVDKNLINWAKKNNQILIAGHTHRAVFPEPGKDPLYFNDGSCVHPRCITGIEIYNGTISLVKWAVMIRPDQSLYVGREILEGPIHLYDYFKYINVTEKLADETKK
jgi:UDP-2,3-diacylglucosamine pyrophosphatase LpxH